jgi:hypothetical protein
MSRSMIAHARAEMADLRRAVGEGLPEAAWKAAINVQFYRGIARNWRDQARKCDEYAAAADALHRERQAA